MTSAPADQVTAWRPPTRGVAEVFHASWHSHAYPSHTHDTWTVLIVDDGDIGFGLDRHEHATRTSSVTLLPPHVPHDGRTVTATGFRKRVIYLEEDMIAGRWVGRAVDQPIVADARLRQQVSLLDRALVSSEDFEADTRLALVVERLGWHLAGRPEQTEARPPASVARELRLRLDAAVVDTPTLEELAAQAGHSAAYLVRAFTRAYGIPPHRYLVGRRLDLARRQLLDGRPVAEVASAAGFYDQAHLTRHFRRLLRTTPAAYQRSRARALDYGPSVSEG